MINECSHIESDNKNKLKTYHRDSLPGENFQTYRKLKNIPYYYYFDDTYRGVKQAVFVEYNNKIYLYDFNYNEAKEKGFDVILYKDLKAFDKCSFIYVSDNYNEIMLYYLDKKLQYLKSAKDIIVDTITSIETEKKMVSISERARLMEELETKLNEILDVYEERLIVMESKINNIDKQIDSINEMKKEIKEWQ